MTVLGVGFKIWRWHINEELINNHYEVCILCIRPFLGTGGVKRKVDFALKRFSNSREGRKWQIQIRNINRHIQTANQTLWHPPGMLSTSGSSPLCLAYNGEPLQNPQFIYQKYVALFYKEHLSHAWPFCIWHNPFLIFQGNFSLKLCCQQSNSTSFQGEVQFHLHKIRRKKFAFLHLVSYFISKHQITVEWRTSLHHRPNIFVPFYTYTKSKN